MVPLQLSLFEALLQHPPVIHEEQIGI